MALRGSGSVVEHLLAKEKVAGSNPVFRSQNAGQRVSVEAHPFSVDRTMHIRRQAAIVCFGGNTDAGVAEWQTLRS